MRAFFALPLQQDLMISAIQEKLDEAGADVSWTRPESMHLTLKFLGDVPDSFRLPLPLLPSPILVLADLGEFDGRIIWAGCRGQVEVLAMIAKVVEDAAESAGIPREDRPFKPHVTIGRIRSRRNLAQLREHMKPFKNKAFCPFPVDRVVLFRSEKEAGRHVYKVVAEYPCVQP